MAKTSGLKVVLAGCAILVLAGAALAQDWPQWRGPARDGKAGGFAAPAQWPTELTRKWQTTVGLGCSTPALVGEKLYVFARRGDDEVVLCLNAADGLEVWKEETVPIFTSLLPLVTGSALLSSRRTGPGTSSCAFSSRPGSPGMSGCLK